MSNAGASMMLSGVGFRRNSSFQIGSATFREHLFSRTQQTSSFHGSSRKSSCISGPNGLV